MKAFRNGSPCWAALVSLLASCGDADSNDMIVVDAGPDCVSGPVAEMIECVETPRLAADIETIAMERVPGSTHWQSIQDLCKTRLEEAGYEIELHAYGTGVNVIGRREGSNPSASEIIVSAHYDHIEGCPGASDNAAGLAITLELARLLAAREQEHPLVVACWDEEERGLIGSEAYSDRAAAFGTSIGTVLSFDAIGFMNSEPDSQTMPEGFGALFPQVEAELAANEYRGDFISLIADERSSLEVESLIAHGQTIGLKFIALTVPEALKLSSVTGSLRRSDHAVFWQNDFPGIHLSDTADFRNPNYHCFDGIDLPTTLDMEALTQVTQASLGATIEALERAGP